MLRVTYSVSQIYTTSTTLSWHSRKNSLSTQLPRQRNKKGKDTSKLWFLPEEEKRNFHKSLTTDNNTTKSKNQPNRWCQCIHRLVLLRNAEINKDIRKPLFISYNTLNINHSDINTSEFNNLSMFPLHHHILVVSVRTRGMIFYRQSRLSYNELTSWLQSSNYGSFTYVMCLWVSNGYCHLVNLPKIQIVQVLLNNYKNAYILSYSSKHTLTNFMDKVKAIFFVYRDKNDHFPPPSSDSLSPGSHPPEPLSPPNPPESLWGRVERREWRMRNWGKRDGKRLNEGNEGEGVAGNWKGVGLGKMLTERDSRRGLRVSAQYAPVIIFVSK